MRFVYTGGQDTLIILCVLPVVICCSRLFANFLSSHLTAYPISGMINNLRCGSQPSRRHGTPLVREKRPPWWPRYQGKPVKWLYRSMAIDLDDLVLIAGPEHSMDPHGSPIRFYAMEMVRTGSRIGVR